MIVRMKVSDQIRKLIADAPVSRHRLAALAGANTGNLAAFMAGRRGLSMETLDAIGAVLGFKVTMDTEAVRRLATEAPKPGRPPAKRARGARDIKPRR